MLWHLVGRNILSPYIGLDAPGLNMKVFSHWAMGHSESENLGSQGEYFKY